MGEEDHGICRLGKRELGPHAFEDRMPDSIVAILAAECETNEVRGVLSNIVRLLKYDRNVEVAYLCTESAVQVCKLANEGGHFCGYRNIQMLLLALPESDRSVSVDTSLLMKQKLAIPQLQDLIEEAWDSGHNAHGRVQTGGIGGTRKHIGASEAEALLMSLEIPCTGTAFQSKHAWRDLLDIVETYFAASEMSSIAKGVRQTGRPPIFLQRPNHSLTIVGIERTKSGKRRLLTFDPAWRPPSAITKQLPDSECSGWHARWVLRQYRKSERYLKRYTQFETLTVDKMA